MRLNLKAIFALNSGSLIVGTTLFAVALFDLFRSFLGAVVNRAAQAYEVFRIIIFRSKFIRKEKI